MISRPDALCPLHTLDHILIEASGVALPGAIAQSLTLVAGLALDAIVVVVDAETVRARAADPYMGDTIARQLADAELVIVNKVDLVTADALARLSAWMSTLAAQAHLVPIAFGAVDPNIVLGIGSTFEASTGRSPHVAQAFDSVSIEVAFPVDAARLAQALAERHLGLVRAKGFVRNIGGNWQLIQVVGRRADVTPVAHAARAGLVCIAHGRPLDRAGIERALAATRESV